MSDKQVRIGVIGVGSMGKSHANNILNNKVPGAVLSAVCDISDDNLAAFPDTAQFKDPADMVASGTVDAVIIATPHYSHTPLSELVMEGLHVLVEKPLAVTTADAKRSIAAYDNAPIKTIFAVMFNQRTNRSIKNSTINR